MAVAGLLLAAGTATPSTAQPASRTLTISGRVNGFADVTFPTAVRLGTSRHAAVPPVVTGTASYAGAYLTPLDGAGPSAGTIILRAFPMFGDTPFALTTHTSLPAGRYRVHLLGDAPTTVRMSIDGVRRDVSVRTRTPSDVTAQQVGRGVAGVDTPVDRAVVPFTVRPVTLAVVASSHESTAFAGRREVCIRSRTDGLSPCLDGNGGRGWYWAVVPVRWRLGGAAVVNPGELPTGPAEVEFLDYSAGAPHDLHAFVLTLHTR